MKTFNWRIPRPKAIDLGKEAVAIIEAGQYQAPSGQTVDVARLIEAAKSGTESYPPDRSPPLSLRSTEETSIEVENETTLSAGQRLLADGFNPVVLNFASATHPGGGFLNGARAQEEYLARSSGLYACLEGNPMYGFHRKQFDPRYSDYVIYSPNVPVFRADSTELLEEPYNIGVITSPAPNAQGMLPAWKDEIGAIMGSRIRKVLSVGLAHGHDAIVLGAWGCGAFGNDPNLIAGLFKESIEKDVPGGYRKIAFAIVDTWKDHRTIGPFRDMFGEG